MNTTHLESLLDKYEREAKNKMIREKDKTAREINHLLKNLIYDVNVYEYIIIQDYVANRMAEANGRRCLNL